MPKVNDEENTTVFVKNKVVQLTRLYRLQSVEWDTGFPFCPETLSPRLTHENVTYCGIPTGCEQGQNPGFWEKEFGSARIFLGFTVQEDDLTFTVFTRF